MVLRCWLLTEIPQSTSLNQKNETRGLWLAATHTVFLQNVEKSYQETDLFWICGGPQSCTKQYLLLNPLKTEIGGKG